MFEDEEPNEGDPGTSDGSGDEYEINGHASGPAGSPQGFFFGGGGARDDTEGEELGGSAPASRMRSAR